MSLLGSWGFILLRKGVHCSYVIDGGNMTLDGVCNMSRTSILAVAVAVSRKVILWSLSLIWHRDSPRVLWWIVVIFFRICFTNLTLCVIVLPSSNALRLGMSLTRYFIRHNIRPANLQLQIASGRR